MGIFDFLNKKDAKQKPTGKVIRHIVCLCYDAPYINGLKPQMQDFIIKAAAVADYRPCNVSDEKIKKKDGDAMSIPLERTDDILKYLGEHKKAGQFLCGFSMETQNMLANSKKKLEKKNLDMIVANNLKERGAGFETDTNIVTMITPDQIFELELMSKEEVAFHLLDKILEIKNKM